MPTVKPPKFSRPALLGKLKPSSIHDLFSPYRGYLGSRGIDLPEKRASPPDVEALALVLATPTAATPPALCEELELLDILADPQCVFDFEDNHGALVAKLRADDDSPGDLALKILRKAPDDAWRAFDKKAVKVRRAMTSYRATKPLHAPSRERLTKLETLMAPWFDDNKRSEVCRVRALREDGGWAFVIRHGDPLSRIPIIAERGESSSALLRPERLDIAFFNEKTGEWLISGVGRELQELYRRSLGKVLHGSTDALVRSSRYTLDPLRRGPDWLTSAQIESVQAAVLKELVFERTSGARVSLAQCDVFAELNNLGPAYVESCQFVEAKLALKLRHRRALVPIVINPSRDSIAGAAGLPAVDAWLANRQFAITHEDITILASH